MSRTKGSKNKIKKPLEIQPTLYRATLKVLGRVYTSQGNTPEEVLSNFKTENWIKGAGVLSVEKDGIKREKIIAGNHIRNVFGMASGTLRQVSLKFITSLFQ